MQRLPFHLILLRLCALSAVVTLLVACNIAPVATSDQETSGTPPNLVVPSVTPQLEMPPIPVPDGLTDERFVMSGICFEFAYQMRDQVIVLRDALSHIQFYGDIDASEQCSRPITRYPFNFEQGQTLAGIWSYGMGCTARHDILDAVRDDANQRYSLRLRFVTEGDCPYELIRPFFVGLPPEMHNYDVQIVVEQEA